MRNKRLPPLSTLALIALLLCFSSLVAIEEEASKQALIDRIARVDSLAADFTQRVVDDQGEALQVLRGIMKAQSPDWFWWEINDPYTMVYRLEGFNVSIYEPDLNQVSHQRLNEEQQFPIVALLLNQDSELLDEYNVTQNRNAFKLEPTSNRFPFERIEVYFAGEVLDAIDVVDSSGSRTEFSFKNVEENVALTAQDFELDLPEDTEVIGDLSE